jgi:hypothetical protein
MNDFGDRNPLEHLDPARREPGFWLRYHSRVMNLAADELARRRMAGMAGMAGGVTIPEVVFAWRRALVPLALLAAAGAGILLATHESRPPVAPVALEEILLEDLPDASMLHILEGSGGGAADGTMLTAAGGF